MMLCAKSVAYKPLSDTNVYNKAIIAAEVNPQHQVCTQFVKNLNLKNIINLQILTCIYPGCKGSDEQLSGIDLVFQRRLVCIEI